MNTRETAGGIVQISLRRRIHSEVVTLQSPLRLRASAACMETARCFHAVADSSCLLIGSLTGMPTEPSTPPPNDCWTSSVSTSVPRCALISAAPARLRDSLLIDHMNKSSEVWARINPRARVTLSQRGCGDTRLTVASWGLHLQLRGLTDWSFCRSEDNETSFFEQNCQTFAGSVFLNVRINSASLSFMMLNKEFTFLMID